MHTYVYGQRGIILYDLSVGVCVYIYRDSNARPFCLCMCVYMCVFYMDIHTYMYRKRGITSYDLSIGVCVCVSIYTHTHHTHTHTYTYSKQNDFNVLRVCSLMHVHSCGNTGTSICVLCVCLCSYVHAYMWVCMHTHQVLVIMAEHWCLERRSKKHTCIQNLTNIRTHFARMFAYMYVCM